MIANRHYVLDAYGCFAEQANSMIVVNDLLVQLANDYEMKPIMPPFLVPFYYCKEYEDTGISAFCICANGSHITIHTFPQRSCYFVDILTDRFFSEEEVTNTIRKQIYASSISASIVDRRVFDSASDNIDKSNDFGPHYMITLENVKVDFESVYKWLDNIAPQINMQAISRPYVIFDKTRDASYISGILVVAQSHVAFHYDIENCEANIDIFSCSFLSNSMVEDILRSTFGEDIRINLLARGSKHRIKCDTRSRIAKIEKDAAWRNNI